MSRLSQKTGEVVEGVVRSALAKRFAHVQRIETGWKVLFRSGRPIKAWPIASVAGDFRAVERGTGRSVLIEVKAVSADRLIFSRLEKHQVEALNKHAAAGGLSILATYHVPTGQLALREWPIQGFQPRTSLPLCQN